MSKTLRLVSLGWMALFVASPFLLGQAYDPRSPGTPPQGVQSLRREPEGASPTALDVPLRLISEARQSYGRVNDYVCLFVKKEQIHNQLQPDNLIAMKVRTQPFSVYLHWLGPSSMKGQEACYVTGKNGGQMRVHPTGVKGALGWLSMNPKDSRVMENSRHPITDAGIGNVIERYSERWEMERHVNKTEVHINDYEYNKRKCTRVETIHPSRDAMSYYSYRNVIYFDKETKLPIRCETYDWPHVGGPPGGDLIESYSYVDVKFNVNLGDEFFSH